MEDIDTFSPFSEYNYIEQNALIAKTYGVVINADDKILSIMENGTLLAQVALDMEENKLSLIGRDGAIFSTVELPLVDVIENAVYDDARKSLIIYVKLSDGTSKEIVVPFNDLLDDYAKIEQLEAETAAREAADTKLTGDLTTEVARATAAEAKLENEKVSYTKAIKDDKEYNVIALDNYANLVGADTSGVTHNLAMVSKWDVADFGAAGLPINLNGNKVRPTYNDTEELSLLSDISAETTAREASDTKLTTDLASEVARATAVEGVNASAISAETAAREGADTKLTGDLATEVARATAAEGVNASAISAETAAREGADTKLTGDLATEVARATAAEGVNSAAISAETTAREGADTKLTGDLATEVARATVAEGVNADAITTKQEILISGTNIKTINNVSLLGSGNISVGGGSTYNIGDGLALTAPNILSVKINASSESYISCDTNGILVSGIDNGLENAIKSAGFNATDIANAASAKAKTEAIASASLDATTKANTAKTEAIDTAAIDTDNKISANNIIILASTSNDATAKANTAKTEAIAAAALDTTNKVNQAKNELDGLITTERNRAIGVEGQLRTDVNSKPSNIVLTQDSGNTMHYTLMVDGVAKGEINIPVNQFLKSADYDTVNKELIFIFNGTDGEITTKIDMTDLVDTYTAGDGLTEVNNKFSIVIDPTSESYFTVSSNGVKISGIDKAFNDLTNSLTTKINDIDAKIDTEIIRATEAEALNASNLDSFKTEIKEYVDNKFTEILASITLISNRLTLLENKKTVLSEKVRTIIPMTVAQYEALPVKDETTLYTLTD